MTTQEKLERIKAKCSELLESAVNRTGDTPRYDVAGWRATIAAVETLQLICNWATPECEAWPPPNSEARKLLETMLEAWPDELL